MNIQMAKKWPEMVITVVYKGTFVSNHSLVTFAVLLQALDIYKSTFLLSNLVVMWLLLQYVLLKL